MTDHHDSAAPDLGKTGRGRHRITDRHVYLLVALEVAVILLWAFWRLLGVDLEITTDGGSREVTLTAIVVTTTLAATASYVLLWALRRHALRVWTAIAGTALLVSCTGPLLATSLSSGVALLTFHVLVGLGLIDGVRHLHVQR